MPTPRGPAPMHPFQQASHANSPSPVPFHPFRITIRKLDPAHPGPRTAAPAHSSSRDVPDLDYFHVMNIQRTIAKSFASKTLQNYLATINSFLSWCDKNNIHESLRFPTSEYILCAFVASLAGNKSKSTISASLAALKAWHDASGRPWNDSPRLSLVTRGAAASVLASSTRPPRKPVTSNMLTCLARRLDLDSPRDAAIFAAALIAFWGQCRLGELLGTAKLKHDPSRLPSRMSLGPPIFADGSRELTLPSTKTRYASGETVALTAQLNPINPVNAITHLLSITPDIPSMAHLFTHGVPNRPNTFHSLTKEVFLGRVNHIWKSDGFPTVLGHSFRIGGTSHLLKAGIAPEVVRSMGRWSSDAHFRYWQDTTSLAINHAENLGPTSTHDIVKAHPRPREAPSRRSHKPAPPRGRPY